MRDYFKVNQISAGWFQGIITDKVNSIYFNASYITDFPANLMYAMLSALGILSIDDYSDKSKNTTVKILKDLFLGDFLFEMKRIIHMYGLIGYRLEWGYEFPLSLYMMLEDAYKKNQLVIKGKKAQGSENLGEDYVMTDFMKECDMISTLREE